VLPAAAAAPIVNRGTDDFSNFGGSVSRVRVTTGGRWAGRQL